MYHKLNTCKQSNKADLHFCCVAIPLTTPVVKQTKDDSEQVFLADMT